MVVCLERGTDLHMAQLMPLPLTVTCFSKIQIGFTFLVVADLGSPGKRAVKWVCVCVCLVNGAFSAYDTAPASQNPVVSCLVSIQTGFTFLVPVYPRCPGKEAVKRV